jgi:hypothetical protein
MKYRVKLVSTCFVEGVINADSVQDAKKILNNPKQVQIEIIKGNLYTSNPVYNKFPHIDVVEPA